MLIRNRTPDYGRPLTAAEAEWLGASGADKVETFLRFRGGKATPLRAFPALAADLAAGANVLLDVISELAPEEQA